MSLAALARSGNISATRSSLRRVEGYSATAQQRDKRPYRVRHGVAKFRVAPDEIGDVRNLGL
jgi:hypothetical protein